MKQMRSFLKGAKFFFLTTIGLPLGYCLTRLWWAALRIKFQNWQYVDDAIGSGKGLIYGFWHGDLFVIAAAGRKENARKKIFVMTSRSRDGELFSKFLNKLGYGTIRGSTSRGGMSALLSLKDILVEGKTAALAVDGPRGPRAVVKPGAILLSKTADALVVPVAVHISKKIQLRSWDRCEIPLPFSCCIVRAGKPISVHPNANHQEMEDARKSLEDTLIQMKREMR
ncbi:MAG TPA: lysophospholipid acyltransferase family protein [Candidatus Sumerlaeota bacterium]|nr:MAG: hypothetical protein BWY12_01202 [candidate division BRC1 bacterium ADurb.Bin183]HOE64037.1 lysophospholipid acyltransferase family protein [Candidatus Sumerlaeota bacterium]HRR30397.1 lysophospholipid acyltransferase family protein [Candidatus Sumerlaeia bacterium]HON51106.1 lysophospholipid acyltransferase family protein [Candidatus Sumerlaeota bacterium]HOR65015.1 lysophospholipid acyltransferase family protein [Candidatus Sumerlaeota bacterium]